jgi:hypothetical protein
MKSIYVLIFLMILSIVLDLNNNTTKKCVDKNKRIFPLLIFHHILSVFVYFGWILNDKRILQIYLFVPPLIAMHWLMNENCILTEYTNETCNWKKTKYLNDLIEQIKFKKEAFLDTIKYHYILIFLGYCIALYKVFV